VVVTLPTQSCRITYCRSCDVARAFGGSFSVMADTGSQLVDRDVCKSVEAAGLTGVRLGDLALIPDMM
jgi:hypothetical protein